MIPSDIIAKKRDGRELKPIELSLFIEEFLANRISDCLFTNSYEQLLDYKKKFPNKKKQ